MALGSVAIIGLISLFMWGVTTFLFAFSGGQVRMVPVVQYGFFAVSGAAVLLAAAVWLLRSPGAAVVAAALGTLVLWLIAIFVEWRLSFDLGAGA
jgi:xanthine/uracil permease